MRTYVVKVWVPAAGEPPEDLRGTVLDVTAGVERPFTDQADLISVLRGSAHDQHAERRRGDEEAR